jgi:uncharacterized protein YndB with AHSA1/START domain
MDFRFTALIAMPPGDVFAFFRDIDQHAGREGTRVPVYDKITPGSVGVGTRYREVVQLLPMLRGEIISEITDYVEGKRLGYRFSGLGIDGRLTYTFEAVGQGTSVVQKQSLNPRGLLRIFDATIGKMFSAMAGQRLEGIKALMEQSAGEAHYDTRAVL